MLNLSLNSIELSLLILNSTVFSILVRTTKGREARTGLAKLHPQNAKITMQR
jgi:hypothetical protein